MLKGIFFELLASNGSCVFTNIGQGNMFRPLMTYAAANWSLLERSEDAINHICEEASIPICCVAIKPDWSPELLTGCMYFGHLFDRDESHLALIVRITRP
ncbi:MAG TPA: hypothetical protein VEX68_30665 [Bryobacteraceae bacterium]|nr:hypothetical protein [Bryobacteraceae bacterium]